MGRHFPALTCRCPFWHEHPGRPTEWAAWVRLSVAGGAWRQVPWRRPSWWSPSEMFWPIGQLVTPLWCSASLPAWRRLCRFWLLLPWPGLSWPQALPRVWRPAWRRLQSVWRLLFLPVLFLLRSPWVSLRSPWAWGPVWWRPCWRLSLWGRRLWLAWWRPSLSRARRLLPVLFLQPFLQPFWRRASRWISRRLFWELALGPPWQQWLWLVLF